MWSAIACVMLVAAPSVTTEVHFGLRWGMSAREVRAVYPDAHPVRGGTARLTTLATSTRVAGATTMLLAVLLDGRLASLSLLPDDDTDAEKNRAWSSTTEAILREKYGEPVTQSAGPLLWETTTTRITLLAAGEEGLSPLLGYTSSAAAPNLKQARRDAERARAAAEKQRF